MNGISGKTVLLLFAAAALDAFLWFRIISGGGGERLVFLDVGQGDAQLLEIGPVQILTDTGPGREILGSLERAIGSADRRIDLVIVTHAEKDHYGGLEDVLGRYEIGAVLWNGREPWRESPGWSAIRAELARRKTPLISVRAGDRLRIGGTRIRIISPDPLLLESADLNDGSLIQLIEHPAVRVLLTGDAGFPAEELLLRQDLGAVDVLKVGHHGSKYSSGRAFLEAVSPAIAVIQSGEGNSYGHPAPEALARIVSSTRAAILRNDRSGNIIIDWSEGRLRASAEH